MLLSLKSYLAVAAIVPLLWQSSAQYGTYSHTGTNGVRYQWNNDAWCPGHGPQAIKVYNNNDWNVTSQQAFSEDCWVQTYPHIGWAGGKPLSDYPVITGDERETGPGHGGTLQWEAAYDMWLNGSPGQDTGYEIMVWNDVSGVSPGGPVLATPVIDGVKYRFYRGQGGNGPASWFVRESNTTYTTQNLKAFISYVFGRGDPVVDTVEFGWEVWGTGGKPVTFRVSHYTLEVLGVPLSAKGRKVRSAMRKEYGQKKGDRVFYASENKGRIRGLRLFGKKGK